MNITDEFKEECVAEPFIKYSDAYEAKYSLYFMKNQNLRVMEHVIKLNP
jgi:hypothetical protein